MELVGRTGELKVLEDLYSASESGTCAVSGRRRVGKTALLRAFCEGRPNLFLTAEGIDPGTVLESLSDQIGEYLGDEGFKFEKPRDIVRFLEGLTSEEKMVVVIDEYPVLAKHHPVFPSILRTFIDNKLDRLNMLLIVCGSSISAMIKELNDGDGPLFNRFMLEMRIGPLPYREARKLNPGLPEEDRMKIYAIASGIPLYHIMFGSEPPEEGIKRLFIGPAPWAELEADRIVALELKPTERYELILSRIRGGETLSGLVGSTGLSKPLCTESLKELMLLGFVRKDVCFGMKKRTLYRIDDGFLAFRYDVLRRYGEKVHGNDADRSYEMVKQDVHSFYGHRFERICAEYLQSTERCISIGSWWGAIPQTVGGVVRKDADGKAVTEDGDIDLVALVDDGFERLLLGECKFTDKPVGRNEVDTLKARADVIREWPGNRRFIVFSRSGFSDYLKEHLEDEPDPSLRIVDMDDMREWAESE